jgi:iron complex outermembrane receptor protein
VHVGRDLGLQSDSAHLRTRVSASGDWIGGAPATISRFNGDTRLQSLYAQDTWRFAPLWKATMGARLSDGSAFGGELANASSTVAFGERKNQHVAEGGAVVCGECATGR